VFSAIVHSLNVDPDLGFGSMISLNFGPNLGPVLVGSGLNHGSEPNIGITTPSKDELPSCIVELKNTVEQYRLKKSTKSQVISTILQILDTSSRGPSAGPQKEAVFESYLAEILSIESIIGRMPHAGPSDSSRIVQSGPNDLSLDGLPSK